MPTVFFILFSLMAVSGAVALVAFRNPVSSALAMVVAFVGLAALFIGLNAYFVGIIQILVYAGAIMVLFIFIIMLLDLNPAGERKLSVPTLAVGIILPLLLVVQVYAVLEMGEKTELEPLDMALAEPDFKTEDGKSTAISRGLESGQLPDTNLIGVTLFGSEETAPNAGFNFPIQITGVLLLVSTVGVVLLSKRSSKVD